VAALHGAVALEQVDHRAVGVAEHLHLDVARPLDGLLEEDRAVAEGRRASRDADRAASASSSGVRTSRSPRPPAAGRRLDEQREADALGRLERAGAVGQGVGGAQHRQPGGDGRLAGRSPCRRQAQDVGRRADEGRCPPPRRRRRGGALRTGSRSRGAARRRPSGGRHLEQRATSR
jgi:hypothetical protein